MTKKRQPNSSIISVVEEDESLEILDIAEDKVTDEVGADPYMNVEISTDNIEDIVNSTKIESKMHFDDVYMIDTTEDVAGMV